MVEIDQGRKMDMRDVDPKEEGRARLEPNDDLQKIQIGIEAEKFTFIEQTLLETIKAKLASLLRSNLDLFAWSPEDMLRIDPRVICHRLVVDPKV